MTQEEIKVFLKGIDVRLQKATSEHSGIPVTAWRTKYSDDVSKLKGIIEHLMDAKHEAIPDAPKSKKGKRSQQTDDTHQEEPQA